MNFDQLRQQFHQRICSEIIRIGRDGKKQYPNFADAGNRASIEIARSIVQQIGCDNIHPETLSGQTAGGRCQRGLRRWRSEPAISIVCLRDISDLPFDLAV